MNSSAQKEARLKSAQRLTRRYGRDRFRPEFHGSPRNGGGSIWGADTRDFTGRVLQRDPAAPGGWRAVSEWPEDEG